MKADIAAPLFLCLASLFVTTCSGSKGKAQQDQSRPSDKISASTRNSGQAESLTSPSESAIRKIDFKNFTYPELPTKKCSMKQVSLLNGRYEAPETIPRKIPSVDCWSVVVGPVAYGDVTGDGEEEAIVDLYAELGGTEGSQDIYIYTFRDGKPVLLWKFATGDRADGGPRRIYAENGELVVELFGVGTAPGKKLYGTEDVGMATPKHYTRTKYKWVGKRFRQHGPQEIFTNPSGNANPEMSPSPSPS